MHTCTEKCIYMHISEEDLIALDSVARRARKDPDAPVVCLRPAFAVNAAGRLPSSCRSGFLVQTCQLLG